MENRSRGAGESPVDFIAGRLKKVLPANRYEECKQLLDARDWYGVSAILNDIQAATLWSYVHTINGIAADTRFRPWAFRKRALAARRQFVEPHLFLRLDVILARAADPMYNDRGAAATS